jgi:hypothetical protein
MGLSLLAGLVSCVFLLEISSVQIRHKIPKRRIAPTYDYNRWTLYNSLGVDETRTNGESIKQTSETASSDTYREKLRKEKQCEINRDLFLEMPLQMKEIIAEIKKRIGSP